MPAGARCGSCAYVALHDADDVPHLTCRRYAPRAHGEKLGSVWPTVDPDDWCGDFARDPYRPIPAFPAVPRRSARPSDPPLSP